MLVGCCYALMNRNHQLNIKRNLIDSPQSLKMYRSVPIVHEQREMRGVWSKQMNRPVDCIPLHPTPPAPTSSPLLRFNAIESEMSRPHPPSHCRNSKQRHVLNARSPVFSPGARDHESLSSSDRRNTMRVFHPPSLNITFLNSTCCGAIPDSDLVIEQSLRYVCVGRTTAAQFDLLEEWDNVSLCVPPTQFCTTFPMCQVHTTAGRH